MTPFRHDAWQDLIGAPVEIRKKGKTVRAGIVDDAMPDSSALWIAADGVVNRELIEAVEGFEVWVEPRQLEGKRAYRMTATALEAGQRSAVAGGKHRVLPGHTNEFLAKCNEIHSIHEQKDGP